MDNKDENQKPEEKQYTGKIYAYIAIALTAVSALLLGLAFTKMGIYSLIASIVTSLAALTFERIQKLKNDLRLLKTLNIITYAVFIAAFAVFAFGIIYSME